MELEGDEVHQCEADEEAREVPQEDEAVSVLVVEVAEVVSHQEEGVEDSHLEAEEVEEVGSLLVAVVDFPFSSCLCRYLAFSVSVWYYGCQGLLLGFKKMGKVSKNCNISTMELWRLLGTRSLFRTERYDMVNQELSPSKGL